jgi:predicted transcriptional regulator
MADESTKVSFVTTPEKHQALDRIARAYGKNVSAVINEAIETYIDLHESEAGSAAAAEQGDFATD